MHNSRTKRAYKDLIVWQKSLQLTIGIYSLTKQFPDEEKFGLTSQMRRASVSIPSNIAEGSVRNSKKDFSHFLSIALGSAVELETQIEIAKNLSYCEHSNYTNVDLLLNETIKMLYALINSLSTHN